MSHPTQSRFVVIGANHRSASLALRDHLFVDDADVPAFLERLKQAGLNDALILSTCDRVEVWACHQDGDTALRLVTQGFADKTGLERAALAQQFYLHQGQAALRHAFAVTASLDSLILGEPHVLGQVKAAHRLARDSGSLGPGTDQVLQAAFACAKRVRSETKVGEGPVSIAAAAQQSARDLFGDLSRCSGLLIGAGDMGELVVESLLASGLAHITVTAPRASRAEALAQSLSLHSAPFETLPDLLPNADILVCAAGLRSHLIRPEQIQAALKKRRRKPIFIVDAAIPGDVDPAINRMDGAFLYDLSDLERIALAGRATREQESRAAQAVLEAELKDFCQSGAQRAAIPAIVALRNHFEDMRAQTLAECGTDAEAATRLLINRLLHAPTEVLKDQAAQDNQWNLHEQALKTLFRLKD